MSCWGVEGSTLIAAAAVDVNLDGLVDVVVADSALGRVVWYENIGGASDRAFAMPDSEHVAAAIEGATGIAVGDIGESNSRQTCSTSCNVDSKR